MPNLFSIIGDVWDFYRKQPVLNHVLLFLVIPPLTGLSLLTRIIRKPDFFGTTDEIAVWPYENLLVVDPPLLPIILLVQIGLSVLLTWGISCMLLIGRRMIQSKAGRSRESFKAVRSQAARHVMNLYLTGLLRDITTILWGVLLIVPGVIYAVRTCFFQVVIVTEDIGYRDALRRSTAVVRGQTWNVLLSFFGIGLIIFLPLMIAGAVIESLIASIDPMMIPAADVINNGLLGIGMLLFTLATIALYGHFRDSAPSVS